MWPRYQSQHERDSNKDDWSRSVPKTMNKSNPNNWCGSKHSSIKPHHIKDDYPQTHLLQYSLVCFLFETGFQHMKNGFLYVL